MERFVNVKSMNRKWLVSLAPLALAVSALSAAPALAAPPPVQLVPGEVVASAGTPNLWVTDGQGVVHFASDTRALAGQAVNWSDQLNVTADQLASLPVGAPWLSAPLVQIGNSIYLPQWQGSASAPALYRIQSPEDLAQLGINAANYGQDVLDLQTWQQRTNLSLDQVEFAGDFNLTPAPQLTAAAPETSSDNPSDNGSGNAGDAAAGTMPPETA